MLFVALLGLVLICNFFEDTYFCYLQAYKLACFYEIHVKFFTFYNYFHLDDSVLWKQYQSVSQEMMRQICDFETFEQQEIPIKFCEMFCNKEICYPDCGERKKRFFCNRLIYPNAVGALMVEGLFSLLF